MPATAGAADKGKGFQVGQGRLEADAAPPAAATLVSGRVALPAHVLLSEGAWLQLRQCAAELERVERPTLEQRGAVAAVVGLLGPPQALSKVADPAPALAALRAKLVQVRDLAVTAKGEARRELQHSGAASGAGPALQTADWVHESANHFLARVAELERSGGGKPPPSSLPPPPPPPHSATLARAQVWKSQWLAMGPKPPARFYLANTRKLTVVAALLAAGLGTGLLSYVVYEPLRTTLDTQRGSAQPSRDSDSS
jgi:hypothetical protein